MLINTITVTDLMKTDYGLRRRLTPHRYTINFGQHVHTSKNPRVTIPTAGYTPRLLSIKTSIRTPHIWNSEAQNQKEL